MFIEETSIKDIINVKFNDFVYAKKTTHIMFKKNKIKTLHVTYAENATWLSRNCHRTTSVRESASSLIYHVKATTILIIPL
jgi:hypothetical protein